MLRKVLHIILGTTPKGADNLSSTGMSLRSREAKRRDLIRREGQIGATLFGSIPEGHTREFFCLDEHTWIWHEEWFDQLTRTPKTMTVRYDFQPRGVLKIVNNVASGYVVGDELIHLLESMKTYHKRVSLEVYGMQPAHI